MATFKENNSFLLVCRMTVNQSVGLVRVRNADAGSLHCDWTLGNAGLSPAVALFFIQELQLKCRYLFFFNSYWKCSYKRYGIPEIKNKQHFRFWLSRKLLGNSRIMKTHAQSYFLWSFILFTIYNRTYAGKKTGLNFFWISSCNTP